MSTGRRKRSRDYGKVPSLCAGEILRRQGWREAFTPEQMIREWEHMVDQVEVGYPEFIYEYWNDLSCREWLNEAWPLLSKAEILRWAPELASLDERFRLATVANDDHNVGHTARGEPPNPLWLRRYPRILVGNLAKDLGHHVSTDALNGSPAAPRTEERPIAGGEPS